jgi:hypothetical protein
LESESGTVKKIRGELLEVSVGKEKRNINMSKTGNAT